MRAVVMAALIATAHLAVAPVLAAPTKVAPEDEATKLKKHGDDAMLDLRYEDALAAYAKSYALRANPALHYNRARALEALGRYADALDAYEAFQKDAPSDLLAKVPTLKEHVAGVRKRVTDLTLKINVAGARVMLRNVMLGTAPFEHAVRVNAGKATLEVSADGYESHRREVELPGGEALTLDIELKSKATGGMLAIKSDPPASVAIDGVAKGTSPIEEQVAAGTHTVTLSRSGYVTRSSTVVVAVGEKKAVDLSLEAEKGMTSKWWFWTGVSVIVIGAAITTTALLVERDAGKGDIDPGRVSAPLIKF
jgi:hypothetical protein